jgi:hypothetical protein
MLIDEIIQFAADDKNPISALLRKCLILAHNLGNERLKTWANHELNGYNAADVLPEYRIVATGAKGFFTGSFGRSWNGAPIASLMLEERHRKFAEEVRLTQPIRAYEYALENSKDSVVSFDWPNDLALYYQKKLGWNQGWALIRAWQEISCSTLAEVIDTVRTRVLNMTLSIQSEVGNMPLSSAGMSAQKRDKIESTIINNIYGGTMNLAAGLNAIQVANSNINSIEVGDWTGLASSLRASGITEDDLADLSSAVKEDEKKIGPRIKQWIKDKSLKVATGGMKIGVETGKAVLTDLLKQYLGLS